MERKNRFAADDIGYDMGLHLDEGGVVSLNDEEPCCHRHQRTRIEHIL